MLAVLPPPPLLWVSRLFDKSELISAGSPLLTDSGAADVLCHPCNWEGLGVMLQSLSSWKLA